MTHSAPDPKQYFTEYCNLHVNNDFMNNDTWKLAVSDMIDYIERLNNTERDINDCYNYMCAKVFDELHVFLILVSKHVRSISIASHTGMTSQLISLRKSILLRRYF